MEAPSLWIAIQTSTPNSHQPIEYTVPGFREHRVVITRDKLAFIAVAGGLVFTVVWLLTTALTLGDASVVVPLVNMSFVAAFVFSVILKLERIDARKLATVALASVAVALLTHAA